jgi:hypothetical protein
LPEENSKHRKVRFTRDERRDLNRLPSSAKHMLRCFSGRFVSILYGFSKGILWLVAALGLAFAVLVGVLATTGISNSYFSQLAQSSLQKLAGPDVISHVGDARLSLDSTGNLAFKGGKITFSTKSGDVDIARIGTLRMGLNAMPLLAGKIKIARLEINDVIIAQIGDPAQQGQWFAQLKRDDGLYHLDALPSIVHNFIDNIRQQFAAKGANEIVLNNVTFASIKDASFGLTAIESMRLVKDTAGSINLNGIVKHKGQNLEIIGNLYNEGFDLAVDGFTYGAATSLLTKEDLNDVTKPVAPNGALSIALRGVTIQRVPALQFELNLSRFDFRNKRGARILGNGKVRAEIVENIDKIEVLPSQVTVGKNSGVFTGAIGPVALTNSQTPLYRFEFVSNDTSLSPQDSPEERLSASVRLAGTANLDEKTLTFSEIGVRTLGGQVYGQGALRFGQGSPEMIFSLKIPEISITHAKQLWPSIFAGTARAWVLNHVYGGTLTNSTINVAYSAASLWPRPANIPIPFPTPDQVSADFSINNVRFDVIGDLPPVREAQGTVSVRGANTVITINKGAAFLDGNQTVNLTNGTMTIPVTAGKPVIAGLTIDVSGEAATLAELADKEPIHAFAKVPVTPSNLSGSAVVHINASFPLRKIDGALEKAWNADIAFKNLSIDKEFSGQKLSEADGTLVVSKLLATLNAKGKLNGIPATLSLSEPLNSSEAKRELSAKLILDDKSRAKIAPGLNDLLIGPVEINLDGTNVNQKLEVDLTKAALSLPWAGWSKGAGIPAQATFLIEKSGTGTKIKDLVIKGKSFAISGNVDVTEGKLSSANFSNVSLNKGDKIAVSVVNNKDGFDVVVSGDSLDLRALLKRVTGSFEKAAASTGGVPVRVRATIGSVIGFNNEKLQNVVATYSGKGSTILAFTASANSQRGGNIAIENKSSAEQRTVQIQTADGGALLSFMDIYDKMQGGTVNVVLTTNGNGPMIGEVDARGFTIIGEPRLKSLVGSPVSPDGQSLSKVVKNKIEVSRVQFDRGNALIEKGKGYLKLDRGILRSDQIGLSYSGTLYDTRGRIDMVGTFMPAFGLNRLFSELPIFGNLLGNGRDKGLIGITFRLAGSAKSPELTVNPMSLIAPGIFRQIFEFQ